MPRSILLESTNAKADEGRKARQGFRIFKSALRQRLLLVIISASLMIVLISSLLLLGFQRQQLIEISKANAAALSNAIVTNLRHAMLIGEPEVVYLSVQAIVAEQGIDTLRLLDSQGRVGASSVDGEVGVRFTQTEAICRVCHTGKVRPQENSVLFTDPNGHEVLLSVNVIKNQTECQTCHKPGDQILGLMMIETPLTALNQQLTTGFLRTILVSLAAFALLIGLIVPVINRRVIQPLEELSRGVAEISAGNLDFQVPATNQDELGELARSFDSMRQQLKITRTEMELKKQELAIMNEVGLAATQLLDLPMILELTLDTMTDKLGMATALIYLWDDDEGRFTLQASRGVSQAQIEEIERRRRSGMDITQEVVKTGKEVFIADMASETRFQGVWDDMQGRSYLKMPLMSRGTVVGVLGVITAAGQSLTTHEVEFLMAVGREIGIAIDNAYLLDITLSGEQQAITLYELGTKISATLALDRVLEAVAQAACELMKTDIGLVGLVDDASQGVVITAVSGLPAGNLVGLRMVASKQSPWSALVEGQPIIVGGKEFDQPSSLIADLIDKEQIGSLLLVPLKRGEHFLGLVEVMARQPRRFSPRDAQLLLRLAFQVTEAIENAQLYRQLRYMAALEERDRLAREMHDHLSQGLGYLKVKAAITDDLLSSGKIDEARSSLLELKRASQNLYTDVREEIFNLRTAITERVGFFVTLQDYLADYQTHYGLSVQLVIENDFIVEFSPEVAGQLLRIIQEALTNVRRHSGASSASIHCRSRGDRVCIGIEDNGHGFDLTQVDREGVNHFGLQIMRERAESIGGNLELDSQPGQGTRVLVQIPAIVMP